MDLKNKPAYADRHTAALIDIALGGYSAKKCEKIAMEALRWKLVRKRKTQRR